MSPETRDNANQDFVKTAVQHGLIQAHHADKILAHVDETGISPSDAALTLSLLEAHEVEAVDLLYHPSSLIPGYELVGLLGSGAAGIVFRAHQSALGRDVALKTLIAGRASPTAPARLQREARTIARLQHPHIVAVYDSGIHEGRYCIAMELVDGESLAEWIQSQSRLTEAMTWHITRQVASALAHASESGIIHRDIKPANILLTKAPAGSSLPDGIPFAKVVDFGLVFVTGPESNQLTATGTTLGTPAYVAPEQLQDTRVDARADIYSLGATVYHMLAGHPPFANRSPMRAIMQKTIGDDRWRDDLPDDISPASAQLFREMTETDPANRIGDYATLIGRIDQILSGSSGRPTEPPRQPKPAGREPGTTCPSKRRLRPRTLAATTFVMLVIAAIVSVAISRVPSATEQSWQVAGLPQPLFNGVTVPVELQESGTWLPSSAADGSRVLAGSGGGRLNVPMSLDESQYVRLRAGVYFPDSGQLEISSHTQGPDGKVISALLRLTQNDIHLLEAARSISDPGDDRSRPINASQPQQVIFQRLMFSRQGNELLITVNGHLWARADCDPDDSMTLRFECQSGSVNLADLDLAVLAPIGQGDQG